MVTAGPLPAEAPGTRLGSTWIGKEPTAAGPPAQTWPRQSAASRLTGSSAVIRSGSPVTCVQLSPPSVDWSRPRSVAARPGITAPITSANNVQQWRDLAGSVDVKLAAQDIQALDDASAWA